MSDSQQSSDQQQSSEPMAREVEHEVQPDEDLAIIALDYGIKDWKLIWEHEKNADLRAKRPDPHVLYKGDKVWIPEVQPAEHEVELKQEEHEAMARVAASRWQRRRLWTPPTRFPRRPTRSRKR